MKNNNNVKIFELFKTLQNQSLTQDEILKKLDINKRTFYKYMKLFKNAEFDVNRIESKYSINSYTKNVELSESEIKFIAELCVTSQNLLSDEESDKFQEIIKKMLLMTDSNTYKRVKENYIKLREKSSYDTYREKINIFKDFLKSDSFIEVTIKNKTVFTAKPITIVYKKNRVYFNFLSEENKIKTILIDRIVSMNPKNSLKIGSLHEQETIFELYGKLAKTYTLREEEAVVDYFDNGIRIANYSKDKDLLFKRLLRYDFLCRIIHPESDRIKLKEIIEDSINNLK